MKKIILLASLLITASVFGQTIDKNVLKEVQDSFVKDAGTVALQNILTNDNNIKAKALSHERYGTDHFFKYRVSVSGITDQKSSGRCWMFTSMYVMRRRLMRSTLFPYTELFRSGYK